MDKPQKQTDKARLLAGIESALTLSFGGDDCVRIMTLMAETNKLFDVSDQNDVLVTANVPKPAKPYVPLSVTVNQIKGKTKASVSSNVYDGDPVPQFKAPPTEPRKSPISPPGPPPPVVPYLNPRKRSQVADDLEAGGGDNYVDELDTSQHVPLDNFFDDGIKKVKKTAKAAKKAAPKVDPDDFASWDGM